MSPWQANSNAKKTQLVTLKFYLQNIRLAVFINYENMAPILFAFLCTFTPVTVMQQLEGSNDVIRLQASRRTYVLRGS